MTKKQFDDLYLGKAVHCDTEEKANKFLELAHGFGYKWVTDGSLLDYSHWDKEEEDTCYNVNDYGFSYAGVDVYKRIRCTIVKFELEPVDEFNVGDIVYDRNGNKRIIQKIVYMTDRLGCYEADELSKTKPLQKITRKGLAKKGYELVD